MPRPPGSDAERPDAERSAAEPVDAGPGAAERADAAPADGAGADGGGLSSAAVLVAPGAPIMDAAAWIGGACWAELRLHQAITDHLGTGSDPTLTIALWRVRAHRAELAEAWHRRLPELRELPRAGFVEPDETILAVVGPLAPDPLAPDARAETAGGQGSTPGPNTGVDVIAAVFERLGDHYRAHRGVAVGPADGPTARTLTRAIEQTDQDRAALAWPA